MNNVRIDEIIIENRSRRVYGDLDSLERSIERLGVLQPVGITPDKKLIFGARRVQACQNLGMETLPARIIDVDASDPAAVFRMEMDENNQRLDLTPSEKVEIARRIEEAMAGRQGNPRGANQFGEGKVQKITPTLPQGKSIDIAAKAVDMNRESYRQAKAVVDSGNWEIIEQMDCGEKPIHKAYEEVRQRPVAKTFHVTLYRNPVDDAEVLISKAGKDYCTKLGIALLKASGHSVDSTT